MPESVLYHVNDRVALITLNRPDRMNAWTNEMESRYFDLLSAASEDPDVTVIVVTGAGRGFCPGTDIDALKDYDPTDENALGAVGRRPGTFPLGVPKPIIGAINGVCAGVGMAQALMFDVRFAAEGAKFTTAFSRRGLVAEYGSSWLLPRLVGTSVALDLLLSARVVLAAEALSVGLINAVHPAETLLETTLAYARDIATNCSPAALATIKRQVYTHLAADLDNAIRESADLTRAAGQSGDFQEGVASYLEKRQPAFAPFASAVSAGRTVRELI